MSASRRRCCSTKLAGNVAETTLYLFDGFNLLHAGGFGSPDELRDLLASWVAAQGARGVLVFDGEGPSERRGPLEVRWAKDADALLERLAAEYRRSQQVAVVSSDAALRGTTGIEVRKLSSQTFLSELARPSQPRSPRGDLRDRLDPETLARLERLRRGRS
jgi:predicted RNA-binding protein with PIN domain